jgi:tRNA nucleotidyltransferase/poly(A) polymerase
VTDADGLRLLRAVRFFFSCGFSARINAEFQIE